MTVGKLASYSVKAYNSARDTENKMHDDEVARELGFRGGLVPGVDVFAYLSHIPLQFWGPNFLEHGYLECRFLKPCYEDDLITVRALEIDKSLQLEAGCGGEVIARGLAAVAGPSPHISLEDYHAAHPPEDERRPSVSPSLFKVGEWLGIRPKSFTEETLKEQLKSVRECDPIYAERGIVHPGSLLRLANWALVQNARLGPWIHAGSKMQMLGLAHVGDELTIRARVAKNYEKKGKMFVELDALVVANDSAIARIDHVAIYA